MSGTVGWLPAGAEDLFGTDATAEESYDVLTVDVPRRPGSPRSPRPATGWAAPTSTG